MSNEIVLGGFIIKIRIKGYLKKEVQKSCIKIDTLAIKTKDKITYNEDDCKNILYIKDNQLILVRENSEFKSILTFKENEDTLVEYLLKDNSYTLNLNIKTESLIINDNCIHVFYEIKETDEKYEYKIEMSDYL